MIQLSPRSYVFNGLELIRQTLIPFIAKHLKDKNKDWWNMYIYQKIADEKTKIPKKGTVNDLYTKLDESRCFKVILRNKSIFKEVLSVKEIEIIKDLLETRNDCAHIFLEGGYISLDFANTALTKMAALMHKIDSSIEDDLHSLQTQMQKDNLLDRPVLASKESMVRFLDDKVLLKAKNDPRATKEILRKIDHTHDQLENDLPTKEDVVNWFNTLMHSSSGMDSYDHFRKAGLTTFEDIREEFYTLCYGAVPLLQKQKHC